MQVRHRVVVPRLLALLPVMSLFRGFHCGLLDRRSGRLLAARIRPRGRVLLGRFPVVMGLLRRAIEVGVLLGAVPFCRLLPCGPVVGGPGRGLRGTLLLRRPPLVALVARAARIGWTAGADLLAGLAVLRLPPRHHLRPRRLGSGRVGSVPPLWTISRTSSVIFAVAAPSSGSGVRVAVETPSCRLASSVRCTSRRRSRRSRCSSRAAIAASCPSCDAGTSVGQGRLDGAQVLLGARELQLGPAQRPVVVELGLKGGAPPLGAERRSSRAATGPGTTARRLSGSRRHSSSVCARVSSWRFTEASATVARCAHVSASHPVRCGLTFRCGVRRRRLGLSSVTAYPPARMPATPSSARACRRRGIGRPPRDRLDASVAGATGVTWGGGGPRRRVRRSDLPAPCRFRGHPATRQRLGEHVRTVRVLGLAAARRARRAAARCAAVQYRRSGHPAVLVIALSHPGRAHRRPPSSMCATPIAPPGRRNEAPAPPTPARPCTRTTDGAHDRFTLNAYELAWHHCGLPG